MNERELFTDFWVREAGTTGKVLGRIPEGSDYRPDPRSRTAQEIAWQILSEEKMLIDALVSGKATWEQVPAPASMKDIHASYERQRLDIESRLRALPDTKWEGDLDWFGKKRRAGGMAWGFLFDIIHHRGQITTYLRPMGSTVPQVYGPTADEP